jgi:hypothetical protein
LELLSFQEQIVRDHVVGFFDKVPMKKGVSQIRGPLGSFSHVLGLDSDEQEQLCGDQLYSIGYDSKFDNEQTLIVRWGPKNAFSHKIYLVHMIPKKYLRDPVQWYANLNYREVVVHKKPRIDLTFTGHWHNPKIHMPDAWTEEGLICVPPLKFTGEKFTRYLDPALEVEKLGFITVDFYENDPQPTITTYPIHLVASAKEDEVLK